MSLMLEWLDGRYGVFRFERDEPLPAWTSRGVFTTVSRSERELSVLCAWPDAAPPRPTIGPLRLARIQGELDFSLTGILAAVTAPLAEAGISVFSVATFDTDYVAVGEREADAAERALIAAGYRFG